MLSTIYYKRLYVLIICYLSLICYVAYFFYNNLTREYAHITFRLSNLINILCRWYIFQTIIVNLNSIRFIIFYNHSYFNLFLELDINIDIGTNIYKNLCNNYFYGFSRLLSIHKKLSRNLSSFK